LSQIYYNKDADIKNIKNKTIAIIGYGSQGHAHARNLHDSGMKVMVGLRKGSAYWKRAEKDGLKVTTVPEATKKADILMILIPDDKQRDMYENDIAPNLSKGKAIALDMGSTSTLVKLIRLKMSTYSWLRLKAPVIWCAVLTSKALAFPASWLSTKMLPRMLKKLLWLMQKELAAHAPVFWKQTLKKKQRPTFLANKSYCAAVLPN
jgi:hypothetical protein